MVKHLCTENTAKFDCSVQVIKLEEGMPGKLKVIAKATEGSQIIEGEYNTVSMLGVFGCLSLFNFLKKDFDQLYRKR